MGEKDVKISYVAEQTKKAKSEKEKKKIGSPNSLTRPILSN